jgi:hypothetical protein
VTSRRTDKEELAIAIVIHQDNGAQPSAAQYLYILHRLRYAPRHWQNAIEAPEIECALVSFAAPDGHDSEAIHEHYVNVGRDALQKAVAVFPSI